MTPQSQSTTTDCLRACIATLLDLKTAHVPDFTAAADHREKEESGYEKWFLHLQRWLKDRNFFLIEYPIWEIESPSENGATVKTWQAVPFDAYCLMIGDTEKGVRHMMVGKIVGNDFQALWDPHPEKPGIFNLHGIGLLVPIDPSVIMTMGHNLEKIERLSASKVLSAANNLEIWRCAREALGKGSIIGG